MVCSYPAFHTAAKAGSGLQGACEFSSGEVSQSNQINTNTAVCLHSLPLYLDQGVGNYLGWRRSFGELLRAGAEGRGARPTWQGGTIHPIWECQVEQARSP